MPESASLHCLGDAGFFIDHESVNGRSVYRESMTYAFRLHNATSSVNKECVATKADDLAWMCMFADYSLPHIHTPFDPVSTAVGVIVGKMPSLSSVNGKSVSPSSSKSERRPPCQALNTAVTTADPAGAEPAGGGAKRHSGNTHHPFRFQNPTTLHGTFGAY